MLFGHSAAVTCLCIGSNHPEKNYVVSSSDNGSVPPDSIFFRKHKFVGLWRISDVCEQGKVSDLARYLRNPSCDRQVQTVLNFSLKFWEC